MKILAIRPAPPGGNTLALFDAQVSPEVRIFDIKLVTTPRGLRVYAPHCRTHSFATFAPAFASALAAAAMGALTGENLAHDHTANAA